ncbi:uncharacterized protein SPAPADRAFT_60589 [Spathaspora passalidarum NRRL Y-27907]|uniref:Uncharacterized protein n=1 Tax=Spathaspora passalidarum (strain NRRL Y-27907 / 11-Y1) TaxID=619300 RepID=G3ALK2_SPAPN|nr:uncharacterized protein SPAPADRAFT_60589 [Spathaspora passalidarum NRRL Y-27907]EGW33245.1 hypothetical protein SPAPADRAFT_60589 [Spathaspora passalidarum NRRL Y-27907]
MSDFAFNNYCINCDKLCPQNSVYCSDECKSIEYQSSMEYQSSISSEHTHQVNDALVSPLLTPALYQQYLQQDVCQSPLVLTTSNTNNESTKDLDYFDLNYSVQSNTNYSSNATELLDSTSHNYRKWLTAL